MPRLLVVGTSDDVDVTHGFRLLLAKKTISEVILPSAEPNETHDQVLITASEKGIPVRTGDDLMVALASLDETDLVAVAWDDSDEAHMTIHALEDFGLEMWNIKGTLNPIEMDYTEDTTEELHDAMQESLASFIEVFSAYIASSVLDTLMDTITERLEQESDTKDIKRPV
jgi:hypothetical protein